MVGLGADIMTTPGIQPAGCAKLADALDGARSTSEHVVEEQQDERAKHGHYEPGALIGPIEAERPSNEPAQHGADDPQQDRNYEAAGIASGHDEPDRSRGRLYVSQLVIGCEIRR